VKSDFCAKMSRIKLTCRWILHDDHNHHHHHHHYNCYYFSLVICTLLASSHFVNCQSYNQQFFRVRPQPNVEVVEGGDAILYCTVGNQAGAVQWSHNGIVLGYNRSIPGYPRYKMIGNGNDGVHNLKIESVKIDDTGEFQCQVGPAHNNRAIRANTKLSVIVRPTSIDIVGHSNGSSVEIRQGETLNLECVVSGGKPAAKIKWFRKHVELRSESTKIEDTSESDNSDTETNVHQFSVSKSTISLTPHAEDNGISYSCEGQHPALSTPLRHTITLSVLFPPGPPQITGYMEGETVRMRDTLTLTCISHGGNPLAQLVWLKNGEQIDFSYTTTSGKESRNSLTFTVTESDNNAIYRCEARTSSQLISPTPMNAMVKLTVLFPPERLSITGPKEAKAGDTITMTCTTARSNPPAGT